MKTIVSLEIVTDFLRAAEIARPHSPDPTLLRYAELPLGGGILGDSEVFDLEVAADGLKELWELGQFQTKSVSVGISSRRIMVRDYEAPYTDLAKIKETLTFEAAELLPSQMDNSVLDFYPIEKVDRNGRFMTRGLLVATAADPLENVVSACDLAGLTVEYVDLATFGLARTGRRLIDTSEEYLLVNIDALGSDVVAVKNGCPQMVRVIPNGISMRVARGGKHRGVADQGQSLDVLAGAVNASPVDSFISALRSTLNFYESRGGNVQKVYICGEGSLSKELQEKLLPALGLPGELISLDDVIGPPTKQEERDALIEAALVSTVSAGLRSSK